MIDTLMSAQTTLMLKKIVPHERDLHSWGHNKLFELTNLLNLRTQMRNILVCTLTNEEIAENSLQISIVWLVIKSEGAAIVEVRCKF